MLELEVVLAVEACVPVWIALELAVLAGCTTGGCRTSSGAFRFDCPIFCGSSSQAPPPNHVLWLLSYDFLLPCQGLPFVADILFPQERLASRGSA